MLSSCTSTFTRLASRNFGKFRKTDKSSEGTKYDNVRVFGDWVASKDLYTWGLQTARNLSVDISLSGKIKKFHFHPGNLSMAVYTYVKPPKKVSGFVGPPVTRAINF